MTKAIEEKSKKPRNGQYQPGDEYIDEMLKESGISREAIFGAGGLIPTLSKRILEKALAGELIPSPQNKWTIRRWKFGVEQGGRVQRYANITPDLTTKLSAKITSQMVQLF